MNHLSDKQEPGALSQLIGAVADSFTRNRTPRLTQLEERLSWLNRWAVIGLVMVFAWFGYQMWGEIRSVLEEPTAAQASTLAVDDSGDEARSSIFLIFAVALGGPVALLAGYLVLGFIYNTLHDALVRRVPLARFVVVPALLIAALMLLESRREAFKEELLDLYAAAEQRIASAKSLRQQARAAGEQVQQLRQLEAQLRSLSNELAAGSEADGRSPERASASFTAEGEPISQEEAVRRLGEMMLEWQGLSAQAQGQGSAEAPVPSALPPIDNAPAPAKEY